VASRGSFRKNSAKPQSNNVPSGDL
jgi:hypothetical protein